MCKYIQAYITRFRTLSRSDSEVIQQVSIIEEWQALRVIMRLLILLLMTMVVTDHDTHAASIPPKFYIAFLELNKSTRDVQSSLRSQQNTRLKDVIYLNQVRFHELNKSKTQTAVACPLGHVTV